MANANDKTFSITSLWQLSAYGITSFHTANRLGESISFLTHLQRLRIVDFRRKRISPEPLP